MKEKKSFRWYEFNAYGEENSPTNKKIENELKSVYGALFEMMGYATGKEVTLEEMTQFAKEQGLEKENGTLTDVLQKKLDLGEFDEKKEERKDIANKAKAKLDQIVENGEITPSQGKILEAYLQSYEAYGTGARDNVLTSATLLAIGSLNARIGCGQGKTDISKAFAMSKAVEGKRAVITSSTPELAAQSFDELYKGMNQANLNVIYLSGNEISYALGEKDEDGKYLKTTKKLEELSAEETKAIISKANVVISDLTSLVVHREDGLYAPNKESDVLLQDEQDADIFNNLWNVEIKGKAFDEKTHKLRIEARRAAAKTVEQLGDDLVGDKISQAVVINGKAPKFNIDGNRITISGTEVSLETIEGIDPIEMQEFLVDAMLASKIFNNKGKDYVVIDGKIEAISPATGSREDIPEGVIQAIAINENSKGNIDLVQKEHEIEKVVSKLSLLKESFDQIDGMSATYGQLGSDVSKEFLEMLTIMGISPELIPVVEIYKSKGKIPNFENIKEGEPPQEKLILADENGEKEKVNVTINGVKVEKEVSPHIAAILRDIEKHPDEAIIIATDDREKTIEITKALQEVYESEKEVLGYSGVPDKNGDPSLLAPPNPANDEKLEITPPKIIVGDHSIGRGVTPKNNAEVEEHLIVAQMPSRSEALLEQFLGRVGRKKNNGSVSFVLSEQDEIVAEFIEKNRTKPTKATEIINDIYQEKTKSALTSTKSDIEISRIVANNKLGITRTLIAKTLHPELDIHSIPFEITDEISKIMESPEKLNSLLEQNPKIIDVLEEGEKTTDLMAKLYSKQYKMDPTTLAREEAMFFQGDVVKSTLQRMQNKEEKVQETQIDNSKEIIALTKDSKYSDISKMISRAKELSELYNGKETITQNKDEEEITI